MDDSALSISSLHEVPSVKTLPANEAESPPHAPAPSAPQAETETPTTPSETLSQPAEPIAEEAPKEKKGVRPSDPMIVFAYDCLRREFKELASRRPVEGKPPSIDDVHRMRIAMRRLRVALRLFRRMSCIGDTAESSTSITRFDFSSTVDVSSDWPPVITPMNIRTTNAMGRI